ncbi:hypothetical protein [Novipirellula artificiosorum]|uniref:DoxX n=1 Tax=Novipirellula artificiosorum TaxID=2528016 RepID=A0A5C6DN68_9BACT|nr:hypothetical protein [Novipirellula artificiosorum]TWU37101.1 hypothetical protein Poly41_32280 [Novipirellula artificiosorum]
MDPTTLRRIRPLLTLLNLLVGWHLLYEGVAKLLDSNWTSAGYLANAQGPLANVFHGLAESPLLLTVTDYLNIAALTLIGLCIMTGVFTRAAAIAGAVLIGLYYLANPPLMGTSVGYASEGHYLIVNKNLIEIVVLCVIAAIPASCYYGLGKLLPAFSWSWFKRVDVPAEMNHTPADSLIQRRALMKNLVSLPVLGGFAFAVAKSHGWSSFEEADLASAVDGTSAPTIVVKDAVDLSKLAKPIPMGRLGTGKLGDVEIGRMICGGNLISGFAHSRDLIYISQFLKNYFTETKVMDTFWLCEQSGINATAVSARPEPVAMLNKYWKSGGKMKWVAPTYPKEDDYRTNIDFAIDNGASAAMIMGNVGDEWARAGKFELIGEVLDYIKSKGVPAGLAGHELSTVQGAEQHQVGADFYMKTLHSRDYWSWKPEQEKDKMIIDNYSVDNYWERTPEQTIAYMETLDKPWIAFKTLAAGAVHPKQGFRYAFENGADFICVGMFDYQVVENANLLTGILDDPDFTRKRDWVA